MAKIVSNKNQMALLVDLMAENKDIAMSLVRKSAAKPKWEMIAEKLNNLGPPVRTYDKWMKVWTDLKCNTKKKLLENRAFRANGGTSGHPHYLSVMEGRLANLLELHKTLDPPDIDCWEDEELIVVEEETVNDIKIENETVITEEFNNLTETVRKTHKVQQRSDRMDLLERQTASQHKYHQDMISVMDKLQYSIEKIENYTKKDYYKRKKYNKEILKLKREKYKLFKENIQKNHQYRLHKLKLRKETLDAEYLMTYALLKD